MRIGLDVHAAEQDGQGNGTYIRGLVRELESIDDRNEYILYAVDPEHPFYATLPSRPGFRVRAVGARHPVPRIPFALAAASFRDRVDILHVQYIAPPVHRGRLVLTVHDLGYLRVPETFSRFFVARSRILVRSAVRRAARIITGSEHSRRDIVETYRVPAGKVAVLPYGVESAFFASGDEARQETLGVLRTLGIRGPYILSLGRLNPRKNLPALARAFARFKSETGLPHLLVLAGKEDFEASRTISSVRSAAGRDLLLAGYVPDAALPPLVRGAQMVVYPSLFEGVGLPVMEAMAAGVPVIASNTTSIPEIAGDAALLVDPAKEDEIAAALVRLASDPALREDLGARGRRRARDFSWESAARRTVEVYEHVLHLS